MQYNILAYAIYVLIMIFIIVWVGKMFHKNGRFFILWLFNGQTTLADTTNNLLLIGYYLFNIGYAVIQLNYWPQIDHLHTMLSSLCTTIGLLVLMLTVLHYANMLTIYLLSKNKSFTLKS